MTKQDHQALPKAKYCPRVAAVSCTQKNTKTHVTLTFNLEMQQGSRGCQGTVHVRAKYHQAKCSGSCVISSALDFGQL